MAVTETEPRERAPQCPVSELEPLASSLSSRVIDSYLPRLGRTLRELVYKALAEPLTVGEKVNSH